MAEYNYLEQGQGLVRYESDFYTGAQVQVMIGEVLVDNAVSIQYQVNQSKTPVYGYASQYFRFVADGPVLITGSLTVAFKESGYLLYTLKHFVDTSGGNVRFQSRINDDGTTSWGAAGGMSSLSEASGYAHPGRVRYRNIEQIMHFMQQVTEGGENKGPWTGGSKQYATLVKQLSALDDSEFENLAETFEDAIWYGAGKQSPTTRALLYSRNIADGETIDNDSVLMHRRLDQYPPCDIWITYGDMEAPDGVNHTVHKLLDVHFTGEAQVISASGEPVYEVYNFFARNRV